MKYIWEDTFINIDLRGAMVVAILRLYWSALYKNKEKYQNLQS